MIYLWHPGSENIFSGYGLTTEDGRADSLVGLLMVDRPEPVLAGWLEQVGDGYL